MGLWITGPEAKNQPDPTQRLTTQPEFFREGMMWVNAIRKMPVYIYIHICVCIHGYKYIYNIDSYIIIHVT